jgi:coatomer protein complex subunit alpha (xenin)
MDDLDLGAEVVVEETPVEKEGMSVSMGDSVQSRWLKRRKLPADLVAAGEFEEALGLLKRRLGVINAEPLEPLFKEAYWATCSSLPTLPQMVSINWPILSEGHPKTKDVAPMILFSSKMIVDKVKEGQKLTTQGKFGEALTIFRSALQMIPLSVAADAVEEKNLTEMIDWCREYVNFTRMEVARKQLPATEVARNIEMAAYLTCCKVQSKTHQCLALQLAMFTSFKNANYVTAASFAKRLVQGSWGDQGNAIVPKARQVLANCEKNANDTHKINFDPKGDIDGMQLCVGSYTLLSPTETVAKCPFCGATYKASYKGKLCDTCQLSEIGANTLGIQLRPL